MMDLLNFFMLVAGVLVFASVIAGLFSPGRAVLPARLPDRRHARRRGRSRGLRLRHVQLSLWIGSAALGVILLDGGLRTRLSTFRTGLRPASWLATLGVVVTAGITGLAASWLLDLPLAAGLLVVRSSVRPMPAAVFSLLKSSVCASASGCRRRSRSSPASTIRWPSSWC